MTQFQPPYDMNYASVPMGNPRPGSITALSIIAIVLGSLFLLCNVLGLLGGVMLLASGGKNPFLPSAPAMTNQGVNAYNALVAVINLCLAGALLAGGIGGLKLRPWARRLMITWSAAVLVWATVNLVVQVVWVAPVIAEHAQQFQTQMNPRNAQAMSTMSSVQKAGQIGGAVFSWIIWCILPVCFLILWRSPKVIAAFEGGANMPPGGLPYPPAQPPGAGYGA